MRTPFLFLPAFLAACVTPPSLSVTPVHQAVHVNAPFDTTWNRAIDIFASRNISIQTMEKASGFVSSASIHLADPASVSVMWADCGKQNGDPISPLTGRYNILVRPDSNGSTIRVTADWGSTAQEYGGPVTAQPCVSTGVWERDVEQAIKSRAEGKPEDFARLKAQEDSVARAMAGLWGSKERRRYYPNSCAKLKNKLIGSDIVEFASEHDAEKAGYLKGYPAECS